ncbi:hypothetical protein, partial [Microbispora sp. NPDC049633]|uniref:hypothetical protein n=1 Tax=Microbispora sp. NPDC049633 TaxID=3154355 RepID=UPI0034230965
MTCADLDRLRRRRHPDGYVPHVPAAPQVRQRRRVRNRKAHTEMSRSRARDPRHTEVVATATATRRLTMAALVITTVGIAAAQPAIARVAPHRPPHGPTAHH